MLFIVLYLLKYNYEIILLKWFKPGGNGEFMVKSSNELMKRIVSLELLKNIKESDLNLEILDNQLYFYQSYLDFLKNNKPLFL